MATTEHKIDATKMNAKQIFEALLAKSRGGKNVTGSATTPACEITIKAPNQDDSKSAYFNINFNGQLANFTPYKLKSFSRRGAENFSTTEASISALKTKDMIATVSESYVAGTKIASYVAASGDDPKRVDELVQTIYGSDAPSVEPYLPALRDSWNVRALVPTGKSTHSIFGEIDHVARIAIDTERYQKRNKKEAIDWGRIFSALKYIGAVNHIFDEARAEYVGNIKFTMPQNNWPKLEIESFHLPEISLSRSYRPPKSPIFRAITNSDALDQHLIKRFAEAEKASKAYTKINIPFYKAAQDLIAEKIRNKSHLTTVIKPIGASSNTTLVESSTQVIINERYIDKFMKEYRKQMGSIFMKLFLKDAKIRPLVTRLTKYMRNPLFIEDYEFLIPLVTTIFSQTTLKTVARNLTKLGFQNVQRELLKMWSKIISSPIDIEESGHFKNFLRIARSSPNIIADILASYWSAVTDLAYTIEIPAIVKDPEEMVRALISSVTSNFHRIQSMWSNRYGIRSKETKNDDEKVMYQLLSKFFKAVNWEDILLYYEIFWDPMDLANHPFNIAALKYMTNKKQEFKVVTEAKTLIDLAKQITDQLPKKILLPWDFVAEESTKKLSQLRRDVIRILEAHSVDLDLDEDEYLIDEGPYKERINSRVRLKKLEESALEKKIEEVKTEPIVAPKPMFKGFGSFAIKQKVLTKEEIIERDMKSILIDWPEEDIANRVAKVRGFADYRAWYFHDPNDPLLLFDPSLVQIELAKEKIFDDKDVLRSDSNNIF